MARPASSLRGMSGSAINARAMPTRSAPAANAASIVSGVRKACEISSGESTSGLIRPTWPSSGGSSVAMSRTYVVRTPTVRFT